MKNRRVVPLLALLLLTLPTLAEPPATNPATTKPTGPTRFEDNIKAFEAADKKTPPPANPTLFVGSSSFTKWKSLEKEFAEFNALNRGFGGSTFPDLLHYFDRVVLPYKPARIVVYEGTNDIASKRTPEQVADDFRTLAARIRRDLPDAHLYILSINPAPIRSAMAEKMDAANALVQAHVKTDPHLHYIDLRNVLTDAAGKPDEKLYIRDRLHPNEEAYARWAPLIKAALKEPVAK